MKASKFTDVQKAFIIRWHACRAGLSQGEDQHGDLLQLEEEVRGIDAVRDEAAAGTRVGERAVEED